MKSQLDEIYQRFHDQVGHPGIHATLHSVQQRYTWTGMHIDVRDYVS